MSAYVPAPGEVVSRWICPEAPAQVSAIWRGEQTECPWCHKPLASHDHYFWSITATGSVSPEGGS